MRLERALVPAIPTLKPALVPPRLVPLGAMLVRAPGRETAIVSAVLSPVTWPVVTLEPALIMRTASIRPLLGGRPLVLLPIWVEIALRIESALSPLLLRPPFAAGRRGPALVSKRARLRRASQPGLHIPLRHGARAARTCLRPPALDVDLDVTAARRILFRQFHMHRFEERLLLTDREIAPKPERHPGHHQRPDSNAGQAIHHNTGGIHHPADNVVHPLVQRDRQHHAIPRLPVDSKRIRRHPAPIDLHATANALDRFGRREGRRKNVILLFQPEFGVHHAIGQLSIVREQQQPLGIAIKPADGVQPLLGLHQFHHGRAVAIVIGGGDKSAWLIEHDVAAALRAYHLAIHPDLIVDWIGFRAKFRDGAAVHGNAARDDHLLGDPA